MPTYHVLHHQNGRQSPSFNSHSSSSSDTSYTPFFSYNSYSGYRSADPTYHDHQTAFLYQHAPLPPQVKTPSSTASSHHHTRSGRRRSRFRLFRRPCCFRWFLSSRGATLRLLGAAVCACSVLHLLVHLFVADLYELLSGSGSLPVGRPELVRNLTWHVGPDLLEEDRRGLVIYSYPHLQTEHVEAALTLHPRILWIPEQLLHDYLKSGKTHYHRALNVTTMVKHIFNCSNTALPLIMNLVNEEAMQRGETRWCFPKRAIRQKNANNALLPVRCKKDPSSCADKETDCRRVTRRQLRTFCLQHHPAVRLSSSWRLSQLVELLNANLKVVHLIGRPVIHRNETSHVHFSARTHTLRRYYHNVLLPARQRAVCEQLRDDLQWIQSELGESGAWYYQRFPTDCFYGANAPSCVLEMFNFLDIYLSENVRKHANEVMNSSRTTSTGLEDNVVTAASPPTMDLFGLSEYDTFHTLRKLQNDACNSMS